MLKKYPTYIRGINTQPVIHQGIDLSPVTRMFIHTRRQRGTTAKAKSSRPDKIKATVGESMRFDNTMRSAQGVINDAIRLYGPDRMDMIMQLPEVQQAYQVMDQQTQPGALSVMVRNAETVDSYNKYINAKNEGGGTAGGLYNIQDLHKYGLTESGRINTYGETARTMEEAPNFTQAFSDYNFNHPTTDGHESWKQVNEQLGVQSWAKNSVKREAYAVAGVMASKMSGLEGRTNYTKEVIGSDKSDNVAQLNARRAGLMLDENMLHGMEQSYLTFLQNKGYTNLREGQVVESGSRKVAPHGDNFKLLSTGVNPDGTLDINIDGSTALFDKEGRPNGNYYKLFKEFTAQKIIAISAGDLQTQDDILRKDHGVKSFTPFSGDELDAKYRKSGFEALWQTAALNTNFEDQVAINPRQELADVITGDIRVGRGYKKGFDVLNEAVRKGMADGHLRPRWTLETPEQMQYFFENANNKEVEYMNDVLESLGQERFAAAFREQFKDVDAVMMHSKHTNTFTPQGNNILMDEVKDRWGLDEKTESINVASMGEMPIMMGNLGKHPNSFPEGSLFKFDGSFVGNAPGVGTENRNGRRFFKYNEVLSNKEYERDVFRQRNMGALSPEQLNAITGSPQPSTVYNSTMLAANGAIGIPLGDGGKAAQNYIDGEIALKTKEWPHSRDEMNKIGMLEAMEWARKQPDIEIGDISEGLGSDGISIGDFFSASGKGANVFVLNGQRYDADTFTDIIRSWMLDEARTGSFDSNETYNIQEKASLKGDRDVQFNTENGEYEFSLNPEYRNMIGDLRVETIGGQDYLMVPSRANANDLFQDMDFLDSYLKHQHELNMNSTPTGQGTSPVPAGLQPIN